MSTKKSQVAEPVNRIAGELPNGVAAEKRKERVEVLIPKPNMQDATFQVIGTSPYVQQKFSEKAKRLMKDQQEAGGTRKKGGKREPKDFQKCFLDAQYRPMGEVWPCGAIPATAFKAAMVAACRAVDFKMTHAKQFFSVLADGYDPDERKPLVKMTKGKPVYFDQVVTNSSGVADVRARPLWEIGWECVVRIKFDADRFTLTDVANLLSRAGEQVGIGEGRPSSKMCCGLGWGTFKIGEAALV